MLSTVEAVSYTRGGMSQSGFFDFREKLASTGRTRRPDSPPPGGVESLTVSELTRRIEAALRQGFPSAVAVRGEVSNFNHHRGSGHFYFTLKDSTACIDCVMFRSDAARIRFTPTDGMELLASGTIRVYAQRGRYQLYVSLLSPLGKGALELALQQLREKLSREGLFDADRKRPLPAFPRTIALITGRQTAALHDILKVLGRFPFLRVLLFPVLVQGEGAAAQIAEAITLVGRSAKAHAIDLILLARGGGSLEDLWAFNEEVVARAIAACPLPIVTGIGHEVDVSIADLVADYHAHTPTEAAQVVVARWRTAATDLANLARRLGRCVRQEIGEQRQRLTSLARHEFFRRPRDLVDERKQWLDDRQRALVEALSRRATTARVRLQRLEGLLARHHPGHAIDLARGRLQATTARFVRAMSRLSQSRSDKLDAMDRELRAISPVATLSRGYSITTKKKTGQIVRAAAELAVGETILTRFADGQAESIVRDQQQMRLFE